MEQRNSAHEIQVGSRGSWRAEWNGCFLITVLSETQEMWVQSLGWEDPLEKEMATHSSILAWRVLWTEELGGLQSMVLQRVRHD